MFDLKDTKYSIQGLNKFKKQLKKAEKQGKDIRKLRPILLTLANGGRLEPKYKDHALIDNKYYKNCRECHITPDWLLIYTYEEEQLILLLVSTGSHSEVLNK